MPSHPSHRRRGLARLEWLLRRGDGMEADLALLGLAYCREARRLRPDCNLFEEAELAATVLVCLRSGQSLHGLEEAVRASDRVERAVRAIGVKGARPTLPAGCRRRPGFRREIPRGAMWSHADDGADGADVSQAGRGDDDEQDGGPGGSGETDTD